MASREVCTRPRGSFGALVCCDAHSGAPMRAEYMVDRVAASDRAAALPQPAPACKRDAARLPRRARCGRARARSAFRRASAFAQCLA